MTPQLTVYHSDLDPYQPAIDPRRKQKSGVITGANFLFDVDGPKSAFGTDYANWFMWGSTTRLNIQELRIGSNIIYCTPSGIWWRNEVSFFPELLLDVTVSNTFWPWSFAQIGGLWYFAQYNIGLYSLNPDTMEWAKVTIPSPYDDNIKFICESYGRLILLGASVYFWSALDNGADLTPALATGAGFQVLGILSRTAFRIDPVADGFIVSTNKGWIKAIKVEANYVWRHVVLSRDVRIFTPNAGTLIPDIGMLCVDENGFHISGGDVPQVWEPLMSEFLKTQYLSNLDRTKVGLIKLTYSSEMKAIFLSISSSAEGFYSIAFVYLITSGKWGLFNWPHHGIFAVDLHPYDISRAAMMDTQGFMAFFNQFQRKQGGPPNPHILEDYVFRAHAEQPIRTFTPVGGPKRWIGTTLINFWDTPYNLMPSTFGSGVYTRFDSFYDDPEGPFEEVGIDTSVIPLVGITYINFDPNQGTNFALKAYNIPELGLNSILEVGLFRFVEQQHSDETSMITEFRLGVNPNVSVEEFEDWNILAGSENWSTITPDVFENWGSATVDPDAFDLELMATNDGINPNDPGFEELDITDNQRTVFQYSPDGYSAVYHRIKLSALEPEQRFHLKLVDIAGSLTGRVIQGN